LLTILNAYGILHLPVMDRVSARRMFSFLPNRTLGLFMSYGEHGMLLAMYFGILTYTVVMKWFRSKMLIVFCFALFIVQLLITQSRATFLGFFVMIIVFFLSTLWKPFLSGKYDKLWKLAALLLLGVLAFGIDWWELYDYLYSIHAGNVDSRLKVNSIGMQIFLENPLWGVGYSGIGEYIRPILHSNVGIHNFWVLEFAATGVFFGTLAVLFHVYLAWQIFRGISKANSRRKHVFWVVFLSVFIWDITMLNFFSGTFVEIFCVLTAIILRAREPEFFVELPEPTMAYSAVLNAEAQATASGQRNGYNRSLPCKK
jgi:hypothetical protein